MNIFKEKTATIKKLKRNDSMKYIDIEPAIETREKSFELISKDLSTKSLGEKFQIILATIGYDANKLDVTSQIVLITRLIPLIQKKITFFDIGTPGTGKSFTHTRLSKHCTAINSSITESNLYGSASKNDPGLLAYNYFTVCVEELTMLKNISPQLFSLLRETLHTGKIGRLQSEPKYIDTSFVFTFNLEGKSQSKLEENYKKLHEVDLYESIDSSFSEKAFLERISGIIPTWYLQSYKAFITDDNIYGYNYGDFDNFIQIQRDKEIELKYEIKLDLHGRKFTNVEKIVSGFIKLLFPLNDYTQEEFTFIATIAYWLNSLLDHKNVSLISTQSNKRIMFDLIKPYLRSQNISRAWMNNDFVKVKFSDDPDNVYCYPLNIYALKNSGIQINKYNSLDEIQKEFVVPFRLENNVLVKTYDEPLDSSEEVALTPSASLSELKNGSLSYFENAILEQISKVQKRMDKLEKNHKAFKEATISTYRELKLEVHSLSKIVEQISSSHPRREPLYMPKAPFLIDKSILENILYKKALENYKQHFNITKEEIKFKNLSYDKKNNRIRMIEILD